MTQGKRVIAQTRARVLRADTRSTDKLVSIFEPQTQIIRKGKKAKPVEFGRMVKVQEAWRAGGEARISRLKRTFGMRRLPYRGEQGLVTCIHWAAIANNLIAVARAM